MNAGNSGGIRANAGESGEQKNLNPREREVWERLQAAGCTLLRDGWPDFLCVGPGGEVFAVEVKSKHDLCKDNQTAVHAVLRSAGIPVYIVAEACTDEACQAEKPRTHEALRNENRIGLEGLPVK